MRFMIANLPSSRTMSATGLPERRRAGRRADMPQVSALPPSVRTISEALACHAAIQPHRPALVSTDGCVVSWSSLHRETQRIAHWLRRHAIGASDFVLLACPDGVLATTLLLGIATGACVVPVDPNLPDEEAGRLLDDLRVAALV